MPFSSKVAIEFQDLAYDELNRVTFDTPDDFDDFCYTIMRLVDSSVRLPATPKYAEVSQALQNLIEDSDAIVPEIIKQVHRVQIGNDKTTPWTSIPAFTPTKKGHAKEEAQNEYRRLIINVIKQDIRKKIEMTLAEKNDFIAQQKRQYTERQAEQKKLKEHKATLSVMTDKEWLEREQIRFNLEPGSQSSSAPLLDFEEVFTIDENFRREQKIAEKNAIRRLKDLINEGLLTIEDAKKLGRSGSHFADRTKIRALIRAHKLEIPELMTIFKWDYQKKNVLAAQPLIMSGHAKISDIVELKREQRANLKNVHVQTLVKTGILRLSEAIRLTVSERELITKENLDVIQKIHARRPPKINHAEINRFLKTRFQTLMVNQPEIKFTEKAFAPSHLTPQKQLFSQDPLVRVLIEEKKLTFTEIDTLWPIHFPKILAAQPFLLQGKLNLMQIKELSGEECNNLGSPAVRRLFQEGWMTLEQARKLTKTQRESIEVGGEDEVIYEINSISSLTGPPSLRL